MILYINFFIVRRELEEKDGKIRGWGMGKEERENGWLLWGIEEKEEKKKKWKEKFIICENKGNS